MNQQLEFPLKGTRLFFAALRPQPQAAALHVLSFLARMKIATN